MSPYLEELSPELRNIYLSRDINSVPEMYWQRFIIPVWWQHSLDAGNIAVVSKVYADSIFRAEMSSMRVRTVQIITAQLRKSEAYRESPIIRIKGADTE
jgi:hypothetical protein